MLENKRGTSTLNEFDEKDYEGEWLLIGMLLSTMALDVSWTKEEAGRIRKKAYRFFLQNGKIWRHPNKKTSTPLQVMTREEDQLVLVSKFHESPWSRQWGTWATFEKLKEKY